MPEAQAVVKRQLLDGRKVTAYVAWGIITRNGDRLSLTSRGWDLARSKDSGAAVFSAVLDAVPAYRSVLEWMHHHPDFVDVTNVDVANQWHEHHRTAIGNANETTIKDMAVCFFNVCDAAGLGKLTIGRHGAPTRLRIDRPQLKAFIEAGPTAPPWVEAAPASENGEAASETASPDSGDRAAPIPPPPVLPAQTGTTTTGQKARVFISHSENMSLVEQVQTMLTLAEMDGEVAEAEETTAIPVSQKVLDAMRRCSAGIIVVSVDDRYKDQAGNHALNPNVLIEIGAAFVLYDKRVVLLWDRRLPVPSNLVGLYRCEFQGTDLSWDAGVKLMRAIQGFKTQVPAGAVK